MRWGSRRDGVRAESALGGSPSTTRVVYRRAPQAVDRLTRQGVIYEQKVSP